MFLHSGYGRILHVMVGGVVTLVLLYAAFATAGLTAGGESLVCFLRTSIVSALLCLLAALHLAVRQKKLLAVEEALRLQNQLLRVAVGHAAFLLFEYELESGTVCILNEGVEKNDCPAAGKQPELQLWNRLVHPSDLSAVFALKEQLLSGRHERSIVLRARVPSSTQGYRWCRLTVTSLACKDGQPPRAVGTLSDIDEQQTETIILRKKAERDPLTDLLNRAECERRVERCLAEARGRAAGAFLLMDMDHFKSLNDSMGHLSGDMALCRLSDVIGRVFRESDISGRMGGDEFMVWLRDVTDPVLIDRKLAELKDALLFKTNGDLAVPDLLLSIGVVIARPGDHFQELYSMADTALYQAKREGRNRHIYYQRDGTEESYRISCE